MATLTIKGIPERLLRQLRKKAVDDRRSLNQEVIHLLEQTLLAQEESHRFSDAVDRQVNAWRRLAGRWRSRETPAEELKQIYAARSGGRNVKL